MTGWTYLVIATVCATAVAITLIVAAVAMSKHNPRKDPK